MKKRNKNRGPPPEPPKQVSIGQRKEVLGLFRECFLALHPKEGWPEWLDDCAETHCHVAEAGQSTFSLVDSDFSKMDVPRFTPWVWAPSQPSRGGWASESCTLTVPSGQSTAYIMVRGYTSGTYGLTISYTRP